MRAELRRQPGRRRSGAPSTTGTAPRPAQPGNGWTIIATLTHRPGRCTLVRLHRAFTQLDVEAWARSDSWCEHCHVRRQRRTTYLLRHIDGRLAQVGSTCLTEFVDSHSRPKAQPEDNARAHPPPGALRSHGGINTLAYLAHVAQAVIEFGFVRAGSSSEATLPTWAIAAESLEQQRIPLARADRHAQDALEWVRDERALRPALDDFEQRLADTLRQDRLLHRELPTAAAAIYAYHQHLRRVIAARKKAGGHIAAPGDSLAAILTVQSVERIATPGGPVHRHHLTDDLGRRAFWDNPAGELPTGTQRFEITIGAHQDDGHPVTVLKHCVAA
jgi:hypothetical protein